MDENFSDGKGPKSKDTPDEFASDWQYHATLDALEREVAGAERRLVELDGMAATTPAVKAEAEGALKAAKAELARLTPKKAAKKK